VFNTLKTITLNGSELNSITSALSITGPASGVVISGNGLSRVFNIYYNGTATSKNFVGVIGYSIAGRVATSAGVGIAGVMITRTGSALTDTTNAAGYYVFNGVPNGTFTVTPSLAGRSFAPASRSVTVARANVGSQNFVGN